MLRKFLSLTIWMQCLLLALVMMIAVFVYDCITKTQGDFVDVEVILSTKNWAAEEIHQNEKDGFVDLEEYVKTLSAGEKTHLSSNYSIELDEGCDYMVVQVVDDTSAHYGQKYILDYYNREFCVNTPMAYVSNNGEKIEFNRKTSDDLFPIVITVFLGMIFLCLPSKYKMRRELIGQLLR